MRRRLTFTVTFSLTWKRSIIGLMINNQQSTENRENDLVSITSNSSTFGLTSGSQKARVITEGFVAGYGFCPACGASLKQAPANSKALDFLCRACDEGFELKSKSSKIGSKIVNGAHDSLMNRVMGLHNPNLYLMQYNMREMTVQNLLVIPRYFFTPNLIEKRKALSATARRAGWVGCNILVGQVPQLGRIHYIKDEIEIKPEVVLKEWQATTFLQNSANIEGRGWLLETLNCIEKIQKDNFTLDEIYAFKPYLQQAHPNNNNIEAKLRQQLQFLRDKDVIEFLRPGHYRKKAK
ncbi:MAG: Dam-replacing family protein [Hyphomonadaceae bacterium]|nr:MAG: Dam-replacing family protein [Hyphomonadaceae bacterium]KAF0183837.1 MAG: Dam-replacing family protein [Hyphomonadaceae bacterium]